MTLANRLTMLRALLSIAVFICIIIPGPVSRALALIFFIIASITDWLDGKIARETNTVTAFGAIADPFVDKLLICGVFIAFAATKELNVPLWAVYAIIARELMVSSLRVLAALSGKVMAAEPVGKFKTVFQIVVVSIFLAILNVRSIMLLAMHGMLTPAMINFNDRMRDASQWLTILTALVTLASGISYLWSHWALLQDSWSVPHRRKRNRKNDTGNPA